MSMDPFLKRYKEFGHDIVPENIGIRQSIRINTLKISEKDCVSRLKKKGVHLERIPFLKHGYWVSSSFNLVSTQEYLQGYYYIQEAASQVPVEVLNPVSSDKVLDMAASPGSKTTQLAQRMGNKGTIIALESNRFRIPKLVNNLERLGVKNTIVYHKDARYASDLGLEFDKVLLDAPCSGNFTQDRDWFAKRSLSDLPVMAKLQRSLLAVAVDVLRSGGVLVYSTCSLEPEENEQVIEWALENLPVSLEKTGLSVGESGLTEKTVLCRRFWPDTSGTQGFFVAKLIRK